MPRRIRIQTDAPKFPTISVKKFRAAVNEIEDDRASTIIKTYYLLALRMCEGTDHVTPSDLLKGISRPYGNFITSNKLLYVRTPEQDPTLKERIEQVAWGFNIAVAKRGRHITKHKRKKQADPEERVIATNEEIEQALKMYKQDELLKKWKAGEVKIDPLLIEVLLGRRVMKTIALPISPAYEPWTSDLLKWLQKHPDPKGQLCFHLTRQQMRNIIRENLQSIMPRIHRKNPKNILRHWRTSHLKFYYRFDPMMLAAYTGWTVKQTFESTGHVGGSATMEDYLHTPWEIYFKNLLTPIETLTA